MTSKVYQADRTINGLMRWVNNPGQSIEMLETPVNEGPLAPLGGTIMSYRKIGIHEGDTSATGPARTMDPTMYLGISAAPNQTALGRGGYSSTLYSFYWRKGVNIIPTTAVVSATPTSVTIAGTTYGNLKDYAVDIVSGLGGTVPGGTYQPRIITSSAVVGPNTVIQIDAAWDIIPNATSSLVVNSGNALGSQNIFVNGYGDSTVNLGPTIQYTHIGVHSQVRQSVTDKGALWGGIGLVTNNSPFGLIEGWEFDVGNYSGKKAPAYSGITGAGPQWNWGINILSQVALALGPVAQGNRTATGTGTNTLTDTAVGIAWTLNQWATEYAVYITSDATLPVGGPSPTSVGQARRIVSNTPTGGGATLTLDSNWTVIPTAGVATYGIYQTSTYNQAGITFQGQGPYAPWLSGQVYGPNAVKDYLIEATWLPYGTTSPAIVHVPAGYTLLAGQTGGADVPAIKWVGGGSSILQFSGGRFDFNDALGTTGLARLTASNFTLFGSSGSIFGADFTAASENNRAMFQTIIGTNSTTSVGAKPLGSGNQAEFIAYSQATPTNSAVAATLRATITGMELRGDSPVSSYQAMRFVVNNATVLSISTAGVFTLTGSLAASAGISGTTGTFSSAVSGTTGTFSSAVAGTTGTFSSTLSATSGTFSVGVNVNTTGALAGELKTASHVYATGSVYPGGVFQSGGTRFGRVATLMDFFTCVNPTEYNLGALPQGMLIVMNHSAAKSIVIPNVNALTGVIGDTANIVAQAVESAGATIRVYASGGNLKLKNVVGAGASTQICSVLLVGV